MVYLKGSKNDCNTDLVQLKLHKVLILQSRLDQGTHKKKLHRVRFYYKNNDRKTSIKRFKISFSLQFS